jgi:hypothetical protein
VNHIAKTKARRSLRGGQLARRGMPPILRGATPPLQQAGLGSFSIWSSLALIAKSP